MKNTLSRRRLKSRMEGTSVVLPPQESWRRVCHRPPLRPTYSSCSKRNVYSHCWKHGPLELSFATHISINTILSSRARQDHNIFQYSAGSGVNELWQRVHVYLRVQGTRPFRGGRRKEGCGKREQRVPSLGSRDEDALGILIEDCWRKMAGC